MPARTPGKRAKASRVLAPGVPQFWTKNSSEATAPSAPSSKAENTITQISFRAIVSIVGIPSAEDKSVESPRLLLKTHEFFGKFSSTKCVEGNALISSQHFTPYSTRS